MAKLTKKALIDKLTELTTTLSAREDDFLKAEKYWNKLIERCEGDTARVARERWMQGRLGGQFGATLEVRHELEEILEAVGA